MHARWRVCAPCHAFESIRAGVASMLALVTQKSSGGATKGGAVAPKSIECVVDVSKSFYLGLMEEEKSYSKFYVYFIESLSVNLREYRTIRMSEFYGMVDTLLHPSPRQSFQQKD